MGCNFFSFTLPFPPKLHTDRGPHFFNPARRTNKKGLPQCENPDFYTIPVVGVEPTLPKEHDFESCASANSATPAYH